MQLVHKKCTVQLAVLVGRKCLSLLICSCVFASGDASVQDPVQYVEIGASVTCTCDATGVPSQYFQWKSQGQTGQITNCSKHLITSPGAGSSQLTIKNISVADQGYYVCNASVNQPSLAVFYVQVLCKFVGLILVI